MSEDSLTKELINGDYTSSTLNTALGSIENKWDFIRAVNMNFYSKILFNDAAVINIMFGSAIAKDLILNSADTALIVASNENTTKNVFASKDFAKEIITNRIWLDAYRTQYDNYQRLKRQINAVGSKLKQAVYDTSGSHTLAVTGMTAYSVAAIGSGAYTYTDGVNTWTGQGAELATKAGLLTLTGNIAIVVGVKGNGGVPAGGESSIKYNSGANTILISDGGQGAPSADGIGAGSNTNGGINYMYDKDLLAPWQFTDISQIGGKSIIYSGVTPTEGGKGGSYYSEYGKGQGSYSGNDAATSGIVVFNYIAD